MRIGKVGETCSAFGNGDSSVWRGETFGASPTEFFPESALRHLAESGENDVFARSDRSVNAPVRSRPPSDSGEESARLQHLDRSVREAAMILYAVIILGMIAAGLLVALLFW